jgi:hypothetical protein
MRARWVARATLPIRLGDDALLLTPAERKLELEAL